MLVQFEDRNGEKRYGCIIKEYTAFEDNRRVTRYVVVDETNRHSYRCVVKNGVIKELVL